MKKYLRLLWVCCVCTMLSAPVLAADKDPSELPWERAYLNLGYYLAALDSSVRLGESSTGIGLDLNVEDLLNLESSGGVFRIEGGWRFTKNKRHKVEMGWFSFQRSGSTTIVDSIEVPPELGGGTISGQFDSTFNFDIIKAKYEYSFLLDDRVDVNAGAGLFIMPFEIGILVQTGAAREVNESVTAPLPVFSIGFDVLLAPKWYLRQQNDFFYLEIDDYEGGIADIQIALEYLPWKNFGFGLGVDVLTINVEANGETDIPGVDFNGKINFNTTGIQLYLKGLI